MIAFFAADGALKTENTIVPYSTYTLADLRVCSLDKFSSEIQREFVDRVPLDGMEASTQPTRRKHTHK